MLATHTPSLSLHPSLTPTTKLCSFSSSRPALADSTNVNSRSNGCDPGYPKSFACPTSSARTSCGWSDFEPSTGAISTSFHPRHITPSPFPVTYKALPTVSISLSEACSQSVPGERACSRVQGLEPDLPDVRSVVPFPSTPLDGNTDVDMLDGTVPCPDGHLPSSGQAPRKRRSAHSPISSSQSSLGKDVKQKRPRKSRRQVAELWWLGTIHRSILRCIEARQSMGALDSSNRSLHNFDAMDRVLVERIQKRLAENGCAEGRALPNPLSRISSPSISVPSLSLSAPSRKTLPVDSAPSTLSSESNSKGNSTLVRTTSSPASKASPHTSLSITSRSPIPSSTSTSHRRHVRFEIPQQSRQPQLHPSIPRRSPSPPARTGTVSANAQTLTLTIPQLVASLTLAYRERSSLQSRGRSYKVTDGGKNAGRSLPSVPCQDVQRGEGDAIHDKERIRQSFTPRARLSSAPEKKSPLSRVAYVES